MKTNLLGDAPLEELVERSLRRDLEAFSEVVRRLHGEVRGFAAMMAVAPDWIDDVAQEIFIEVYQGLDRYDPKRSFLKWVRGVTRNVIRRHGERQSRESRLRQDAVSVLLRRRREELAEEASEGQETPLEALRNCLERLPEHLRRLVDLQFSQQLTSAAIARIVERSADAVRMALMRTRALLLQCIRSQTRREGVLP